MLELMEQFDRDKNPVVFSLKYVSFNRFFLNKVKRLKAIEAQKSIDEIVLQILNNATDKEKIGKIVFVKNAVLARNMRNISNTSAAREPIVTARSTIPNKMLRSSIRRLFLPDTMQIRNCYLRLIIEFNGHPVIY